MENFDYSCKCGKPVLEEEQVHIIHIRHGKILGHAEGTYDGRLSVKEKEGFNNKFFGRFDLDNPNCFNEIFKSCSELEDSEAKVRDKKNSTRGKL